MSDALKFMSCNLRVACPGDGINMFFNRAPRVAEMLEREKPDVVGFQEVTDSMRAWLREHLPGYTTVGCGREKNCHGESMLIAYRTDEVELMSLDNLWLSPTPRIPGSRFGGDQSVCPRMMTTALFKHDRLGRPFRFINTHLDHAGANARYLGAMELVQIISSYREPFVLTGDFNATPDAPEIKLITKALADRAPGGVIDCTADLPGTFHDFGRLTGEKAIKIDYIFTDGTCLASRMVEDVPVGGQYYSDHCAVTAIIRLGD